MNILYTSGTNLGFETYVAPSTFDRAAQPVDIYDVFSKYYKANREAKYIYSIPDTFTDYYRLAPNECPIQSDGTSYRYGYNIGATKYVVDIPVTTAVGLYPEGDYDTITVLSTAGYPNSGKLTLGKGYANYVYNQTLANGFFVYTSKDATHFYGVSQRTVFSGDYTVAPIIDWTGTTKRYVIVNNTNMSMQSMKLANYIKSEWLYCGDKIDAVNTGTGSIAGSTTKWIHIHKLNNIARYEYCCHYQSILYGELHLSTNPACTYISSLAFLNQTNITGILDIPSNITEINGDYGGCFYGLGVTEIKLNSGLVTIGQNSLGNNTKVNVPVVIPDTVTSIGYHALWNIGIANGGIDLPFNIPASVTTITPSAFASSRFTPLTSDAANFVVEDNTIYDITGGGCKALHSDFSATTPIIFRSNVTEILQSCYYASLRSGNITIPNTVTIIHDYAFFYSVNFTGTLNITSNVTYIGANAFSYSMFTSLILEDGITYIGAAAFFNLDHVIGNLIIPNSVTYIGDSAFESWSGITAINTLTLPISSCVINNEAFYNSHFGGDLIINASISTIGVNAFGNTDFTNIISTNTSYPVSDNVLYDVKTSGRVKAIASARLDSGTLTLRSDITDISNSAFIYNLRTGTLILPATLTVIDYGGFYGCSGFTGNLVIPNNVVSVSSNVFYGCNGFTGSIVINNPTIILIVAYDTNYSFRECINVTGLELIVNYNGSTLNFNGISNNFSALSLNQSLLNITDGTIGSPKTFKIGAINKAHLLASYPNAETDAAIRYILIT